MDHMGVKLKNATLPAGMISVQDYFAVIRCTLPQVTCNSKIAGCAQIEFVGIRGY